MLYIIYIEVLIYVWILCHLYVKKNQSLFETLVYIYILVLKN